MSLESRSKDGYLIGFITIIICIFVLLQSGMEINTLYSYRDLDGYTDECLFRPIASLITCLIMIIFSSLMIVGIAKKRHKLMTPWLIFFFVGIIYEMIYVGFFNFGFVRIQIGMVLLIVIGMELLMVCPIYVLYNDIRFLNIENPQKKSSTHCEIEKDFPHQTEMEMV